MTKKQETFPYRPSNIANYFLWRADEEGIKDMTPMKLIKLVYIAYGWCYAVLGQKIFGEKIEAWRHGPVVPSVYHEFKRFGSEPINRFSIEYGLETGATNYPVIDQTDEEVLNILGAVWNIYKDKDGIELSRITHEDGSPWNKAYDPNANNPMNDNDIKERSLEAIHKYVNTWGDKL